MAAERLNARGYHPVEYRDPAGRWTFYSDVEPLQSCNRFFGSAVAVFRQTAISIDWTGPRSLSVRIAGELEWDLTAKATPITRLMNGLGSLMPDPSGTIVTSLGRWASWHPLSSRPASSASSARLPTDSVSSPTPA